MDNCFAVCGCDDYQGISKTELDRYTDTIENVLNDEKGRKFFRNFMFRSNLKAGRRTLDFWEHAERLLGYKENAESASYRSFLRDVDRLIDEAERVDDIDMATIERATIARDSENKEAITEALKCLKQAATGALSREYTAFRNYFIPAK